jgi:hypothetical protein
VTETRPPDERLVDAFRALEDPSGGELSDDLRDEIWLAVTGALPADRRRLIVDRMATDPACAEAWRIAHAMWLASQGTADAPADRQPSGARRWVAPWMAAAAALIVGTTIGLVTLRDRRAGDEFRAPAGYAVQARQPDLASLPREAFRLEWTPGPEGSRYHVRVTDEDLTLLATAADLNVPSFTLAPVQLAPYPAGAAILWQVEATLPDGERVTSRTFVTRVQ